MEYDTDTIYPWVTIGLHGLAWPNLCVGDWRELYTPGSSFVDLAKQSLIDGVAF